MFYARARLLAICVGVLETFGGCHAYDESLLQSERSFSQRPKPSPASQPDVVDAATSDASSVSRDAAGDDEALDSAFGDSGSQSEVDAATGDPVVVDAAIPNAGTSAVGAGGVGGEAVGGGAGTGGIAGGSIPQAGAAAGGGVAVVAVECADAGGQVWQANGHCYFPLSVMNTWFVSRDRCRELGAHLVSISSAAEQVFVSGMVGVGPRWTGLSRFGAPAFSWVDGESMTYENWEAGAPNQKNEAAVAVRNGTFLWFDDQVSQAYAAICERQ
jgi:hypothetical protein